jgi:hypothetical protein
VISGAPEDLIGGDIRYVLVGGLDCLVDEQTGEITWVAYLTNVERIEAMRPVGKPPPE